MRQRATSSSDDAKGGAIDAKAGTSEGRGGTDDTKPKLGDDDDGKLPEWSR
jgi:hypothetical protein